MAEDGADQALGLRRLMLRRSARLVPFLAATARAGQTSIVVNVAAALAARGVRVAIVDEHASAGNACDLLSLHGRRDLDDFVAGKVAFERVLLGAGRGICVVSAERLARRVPELGERERARLHEALDRLMTPGTVVLLDATRVTGQGLVAAAGLQGDGVLVVPGGRIALQDAYRTIKAHACRHGLRRFRILPARVAGQAEAHWIGTRLAHTTRRYLDAVVTTVGSVPHDPSLARATARRVCVVDVQPRSAASAALYALADALSGWVPGVDAVAARESVLEKLRSNDRHRNAAACLA